MKEKLAKILQSIAYAGRTYDEFADNLLKSGVIVPPCMGKAIYFITMDEAVKIVKEWENNPEVNNNFFIAIEGNKICAIDNTSGECYAEDFCSLEDAVNWLFEPQ